MDRVFGRDPNTLREWGAPLKKIVDGGVRFHSAHQCHKRS